MASLMNSFALVAFAWSLCFAVGEECGESGAGSCMVVEDDGMTSFLQINQVTSLGIHRDEGTQDDRSDTMGSRHGKFHNLKSYDGEECGLQGTWHHRNMPAVSFSSKASQVFIGIPGLPTLMIRDGSKRGDNLPAIELDGTPVFSNDDIVANKSLHASLKSILTSDFASRGGKHMSSLLGVHGHYGSKSLCNAGLHQALIILAKGERVLPKIGQNLLSTGDSATWTPYGYDEKCPRIAPTTWECTCNDKDWYTGGVAELRSTCNEHGGDVHCRSLEGAALQALVGHTVPDKDESECAGMCGATCDCWEGLCGETYACDYNGMCCAHDYTCIEHGMVSLGCANAKAVYDACKDSKDVRNHPEKWGHVKSSSDDDVIRIKKSGKSGKTSGGQSTAYTPNIRIKQKGGGDDCYKLKGQERFDCLDR